MPFASPFQITRDSEMAVAESRVSEPKARKLRCLQQPQQVPAWRQILHIARVAAPPLKLPLARICLKPKEAGASTGPCTPNTGERLALP